MSPDRDLMDRLVQVVSEMSEQGGEAERSRFYTGLIVLANSGSATPPPAGFVQVRFEGVGQLARYFGNEPAVNDYVDVLMVYDQTPIILQNHTGGLHTPGWPFDTEIATVDTTDPDADYTTIALAIAAGGDNTILMSPETHVCQNQHLNAGENLRGMDLEASILQSTAHTVGLRGGDGCHIMDITIRNDYDVAGYQRALYIDSDVDDMELWRVRVISDNQTDDTYNLQIDDAVETVKFWNCYLYGDALNNSYGLWIDNAAVTGPTIYIYGGYFRGGTADIYVGNNATVYLYGPTLEGSTITVGTGTTVQGWYYKADGTLMCAGDVDIGSTTITQKTGHVYQAENHDVYPNDERYGWTRRLINQPGLTVWTSHFRTGDAAGAGELAAFAWQGAPFVAAANLNYSDQGEYLVGRCSVAAGRSFMSHAIANAAASWQDKSIFARFNTGQITHAVVRIDANDDNNWVELRAQSQGDATFRIEFWYMDAGVGPTTVTSNLIIPCSGFITVRLFCDWTGAVYNAVALIVAEQNDAINITGFLHQLTGNWAAGPPVAGRVGLGMYDQGNFACFDWFWDNFT